MLKKEEILEIKEILEESQNPLFFFDNDADGLCSFLLLQRAIERGKGVAIKSFPALNASYLRKIDELNPDAVFILDKPSVEEEFLLGVLEKGIPVIWIDHHNIQLNKEINPEIIKKIKYYNSFPTSEPVTYICYKISGKKDDEWIAMIGCVGDVYMPDFAKDYAEENPDFFNAKIPIFDAQFKTKIGEITRILNFGLKDTTTNVVQMLKFLTTARNINDLLEENYKTKQFHHRYNQLNRVYLGILKKAEEKSKKEKNQKLIFFTYKSEIAMSSEISNALLFMHPKKIILVGTEKQGRYLFSARGENVRDICLKAIEGIEGASGGGHEKASGVQIPESKLEEFQKKLEELVR